MYCRTARRRASFALLAILCGFAAGCTRRATTSDQVVRLAVLRFENLGADESASWMGRAFAEVIGAELAADPALSVITASRLHNLQNVFGARPITAPGISAERPLALAAGATRIAYGDYASVRGRLVARLFIEDPASGRVPRVLSASASAGDVISAATALAREVSSRAANYGTRNEQALASYVAAMESPDSASITPALERAIAADPNFAAAYELLAQIKEQRQDRAGALAVLESALAHGVKMTASERARLELEKANITNDGAARDRALSALTAAAPRDPAAWRSLAETSYARRDYRKAIDAYRKLLELEPQDAAAWNQLAYAAAGNRDLDTATKALRRYQEIRPSDPNPADSLGDVNLMLGNLGKAEELYLQVARKNPEFLNSGDYFKAAMTRLMSGDVAGADALATQYIDARRAATDASIDVLRVEWSWTAGRRKPAYHEMEAQARRLEAGKTPALASRAYADLSLWSILLSDRGAADRYAQRALQLGGVNATTAIARFISITPAPADWEPRANQMFPNATPNSLRDVALALALLIHKEYRPASVLLRQLYESPGLAVNDPGIPIELAWALVETGRVGEAAPLLELNPVPPPTGPGALMSLYFPRLYYLRSVVAEKSGNAQGARANREMFLKLSGPEPIL